MFVLTSSAFHENSAIPRKYTCDGADVSVPLSWSDPPESTAAFALVVEDPDAPSGLWVHWVLYDVPAAARQVPEAVPADGILKDGSRQGVNDFRKTGYGGPCPPRGPAHHYVFTLYALSQPTGLKPGADRRQLLRSIKGHTLAQTQLIGVYGR